MVSEADKESQIYEVLIEHSVKYTNKLPLSVQDVIQSLAALEKVSVHFLPQALSELTGAGVMSAELLVEGFQQGSFIEDTIVRLVFKDKENMDKFIDKVREKGVHAYRKLPGNGKPVLKAIAVSSVIGALVATGAIFAINSTQKQAAPALNLNISDSTFVVIGAESYSMSPEKFAEVIEKVGATDKKKLAQAAVKIIAPAKKEEGATVAMTQEGNLALPPETVKATPDSVDFDPFEIDQPHPDADVEIRATDLDSSSRGWAAIIRGVVDRRVKLILEPGVDPQDVAGKFKLRADVLVKFRMSSKTNKMEPISITIQKVIED
ncbi:hypothetical protein [Phytopseudomonas punonensis]|uniref:Uncharacterized protein n=1 Tax=Phytopseudomonas punonensis TaxID=1220495 RepID=A0A1M7LJ59_9GAMM|nr:hypothetical protein [Pseudomonas punonensis]SHM78183.1 hypothetical protein SAMN05216288_4281 [Pseudomonas punonensis]